VCLCVCLYVCVYGCMYVSVCVCVSVCLYFCLCVVVCCGCVCGVCVWFVCVGCVCVWIVWMPHTHTRTRSRKTHTATHSTQSRHVHDRAAFVASTLLPQLSSDRSLNNGSDEPTYCSVGRYISSKLIGLRGLSFIAGPGRG
jgi:hypothetical protein